MQRLLEGIRLSYKAGPSFSTENIAKGQKPEVLLVTCADSRIVPHLVTGTGPGDIFVVRNAGNMLPDAGTGSSEEATIEYGIEALGIRHLIVCGHTHCGAMRGLIDGVALPAVHEWLKCAEETRTRLARRDDEDRLSAAIEENVIVQLERARLFPCVAAALKAGKLTLHGWVYDIETTHFQKYDDESGAFVPLDHDLRRIA